MNNIIHIFKSDLNGLKKNFFAMVIVGGLCILPSLYAWFNIYSNWDPYANTGGVPIAVFSADEGYLKEDGTQVNMGSQVIESLQENNKLGWQFPATKDEAIEGVYSGQYYAALIMDENFSQSMYDCLANGMEHPKIYYYENEKRNAIAVKITDSGSTSLQSTINEEFTNVVVTTLSENIGEMTDEDGSIVDKLESDLQTVNDNLTSYSELLDSFVECNTSLSDSVLGMKDILPKLNAAIASGNSALGQVQSGVNTAANATNIAIGTKLNSMSVKATVINNAVNVAQTALAQNDDPAVVTENLNIAAENLGSLADDAASISNELENLKGYDSSVDAQISAVQASLSTISNGAQKAQTSASKAASTAEDLYDVAGVISDVNRQVVSSVVDQAVAQLPAINQELYNDLSTKVNSIASEVNSSVGEVSSSLSAATTDTSAISSVFDGVSQSLLAGNAALTNSKGILDDATGKLQGILDELNGVEEDEKYQKLLEILANDPSLYGEFLSQPVTVNTVAVYETPTYGCAVTPFYTTLALWVGAILLVSVLNTHAKLSGATHSELFMGRFILFFVLSQIQAVICIFGDLNLLDVQCNDVGKFYLAASVTSFTYMMLIYALTISFGDVGKALTVVVMVIQIAGSSGTYPIELLPEIFQRIYKFFPFVYSINAMREVISGQYGSDYWTYLGQLLVFAVAALIIGLVIRLPFMKIHHFFEKRMEDTGLM